MDTNFSDLVRERAHLIWEREGRPDGRDAEHWAQAEREIDNEATARRRAEAMTVTADDDPTRPAGAAVDDASREAAAAKTAGKRRSAARS
jgi:hypothetical protein